MRILSIDVGIKNLAFCLIESNNKTFNILKWEVINLCNENTNVCQICQKKAKFYKQNESFCQIHAKKNKF